MECMGNTMEWSKGQFKVLLEHIGNVSQERFTAAGLQGAGGNSAVVHQERGTG